MPRAPAAPDTARAAQGLRFAATFFGLMLQVWERAPFPVAEDVDPVLAQLLEPFRHRLGDAMPVAALHVFVSCWIQLYGTVSMEVHGQLDFAGPDGAPLFEAEMRGAAARLGCPEDYEAPQEDRGAP